MQYERRGLGISSYDIYDMHDEHYYYVRVQHYLSVQQGSWQCVDREWTTQKKHTHGRVGVTKLFYPHILPGNSIQHHQEKGWSIPPRCQLFGKNIWFSLPVLFSFRSRSVFCVQQYYCNMQQWQLTAYSLQSRVAAARDSSSCCSTTQVSTVKQQPPQKKSESSRARAALSGTGSSSVQQHSKGSRQRTHVVPDDAG